MCCINRSIDNPLREDLTWVERWNGPDRGLICSWEVGRRISVLDPILSQRAASGELVSLPWKSDTFYYLAMWQGLRGEDLAIDITTEQTIICQVSRKKVVYKPVVTPLEHDAKT